MRFHHVGYAVSSIHGYLEEFVLPLLSPARVSECVTDPIQQVTVCFVEMQGGTVIELVEPAGDKSPVHSVLAARRGGLYHLCYEVDGLDATVSKFRRKGCLPLGRPQPAVAFGGRRIAFLLTPQRDLLELLETTRQT